MKSATASLLSTASLAALAAPATVGDASGAWLRLVPAGKFKARDGREFDAGDRAEMETIVARSRDYHATTDIVVDYDHQSMFGAKDGVGGTARAAGWIKELQVRDDGIYGRVEWTASAKQAIEAGEYRYLSPVIPHRKKDGRVLLILNAALTNTPALDLEAAAASTLFPDNDKGPEMDKILAALGLTAGSTEAAALSAIEALKTSVSKIATAAGQKAEATADEIVTAVAALKASPDPAKFAPVAALTELQNKVKSLEEGAQQEAALSAVAEATKSGKLTPAMRDWGLALFKSDKAAFDTFIGAAPTLTGSQLKDVKRPGADAVDLTDPAALSAAATVYQKKQKEAGFDIDFVAAVRAVEEGKK